MAVSISVVFLLVILAVIFVRSGALKLSHAILCVMLGFSLSSTSLAPTLYNGLSATAEAVSSVGP